MSLVTAAGRWLPRPLKEAAKREIYQRFQIPSMEWSLANLQRLGFRPSSAVDIGAYRGEWTLLARRLFPEAAVLMIEAQDSLRPVLQKVSDENPGRTSYRITLLGPECRENVEFHEYENAPTASSVLADQAGTPSRLQRRKMETLDGVLAQISFRQPQLLKLDVQGYELEVLKGGSQALAAAEAVVMEVSLIDLYENSPLIHDVLAFMHDRDFLAYDIPSLIRRSSDQALCQIDMIFLKKSSPLIQLKTW
jgi:FkbM family methyltransferase